MKTPTVRMHLWLESGESVYFGMGRVMLLDKIEEHGSLRKAAEALGMSYRAAWGKLKATEEALGLVLVESSGTRRGGSAHPRTLQGLVRGCGESRRGRSPAHLPRKGAEFRREKSFDPQAPATVRRTPSLPLAVAFAADQ
jgi:molybdate transport repressor ModE-like protein